MKVRHSIILVRPQLEENIGAVARVAANFGFHDLRIVSPSCNHLGDKAQSVACSAVNLLESAQVFSTVENAVHDLRFLYALSARARHMEIDSLSLPEITIYEDLAVGFMFGPEKSGLSNDDLALVDKLLMIETSDVYKSLNLAQAVAIVCYEVRRSRNVKSNHDKKDLATKKEIQGFYEHLECELQNKNFFRTSEKVPTAMLNIKNMFKKHEFTGDEIKTLRGIIKALSKSN